MTVTSAQNLVSYAGNDSTTVFAVPFKFFVNGDLVVLLRTNSSGADTPQTLTTHYTVTGAGNDAGGTLTMLTAPATGETLVIYGDPDLKQEVDYTTGDPFPAQTHEDAVDLLTNQQKATRSRVDRALRFPFGDSSSLDPELPSSVARASKVLAFDSSGEPTLLSQLDQSATTVTASGSTTARTLAERFAERLNVKDFGAVGDGATDDQAAIQAAIDAAEAAGGGVVYFPASTSSYLIGSQLTITISGVRLRGDGSKASVIAPNFDTTAAIFFDGTGGTVEQVGAELLEVAHSGRTAGPTFLFHDTKRGFLTDVEVTGAAVGLQMGTAADTTGTVIVRLTRVRMNTSGNGIDAYGESGLFLVACHLNGTAGNNSTGINVPGTFDGLWVDDETLIETHDTGVWLHPSSGSCANIYLRGFSVDRPDLYGIRIQPTGTGTINNVHIDKFHLHDTVGSGDTDGIGIIEAVGTTVQRIKIRTCFFVNTRQRCIDVQGAVQDLQIIGCQGVNGGQKAANTYPGIWVRGAADRVTIVGNQFEGQHSYGMRFDGSETNMVVTGNNVEGDTAPILDSGTISKTRQIYNNAGERTKRGYLIGPFTYTNLTGTASGTKLQIPTVSSATLGFMEQGIVMPRKGRVSGITVHSREARTGGTCVVKPQINGSAGTLSATLDGTDTLRAYGTQDSGDTYAAGDALGVEFTTSGWTPTSTELVAYLEVEET